MKSREDKYGSEYSRNIHELIGHAQSARKVQDLLNLCQQVAETLEMEYFSYGLELPDSVSQEPKLVLYSSYSDKWLQHYQAQTYFDVDPVIEHCATQITPLVWDSEQQLKQTANQKVKALMADAIDHEIKAGVVVPIKDGTGHIAGFNLSSSQPAEQQQKKIRLVTPFIAFFSSFLHEKMLTLHAAQKRPATSPITSREADCLSWAASGKTASEIADILNVSEHTVHFHIRNAVKKLHASNKTHAVAKAITFQYIHPDFR